MSETPPPPPGPPGQGGPQEPYGSGAAQPPGGYGAAQPPGGYGYGAPPGYGGPAPRNSGKAVTALVLGILASVFGLCCAFIGLLPGIAAIVVGRSAKQEIGFSGGRLTGAGMAQAGVLLGIVGCAIAVVMTVVNVFLIQSGVTTFDLDTGP